jgi:DNA-binding NarL/FixJ family response regulator
MRFASIVLVEDQAIRREGLRALLELERDLGLVKRAPKRDRLWLSA